MKARFFRIHFNTIVPSSPVTYKHYIWFKFSEQSLTPTSHRMLYVPPMPSYLIWSKYWQEVPNTSQIWVRAVHMKQHRNWTCKPRPSYGLLAKKPTKYISHTYVCAYWTDPQWCFTTVWSRIPFFYWCLRKVGNRLSSDMASRDALSKRREPLPSDAASVDPRRWRHYPLSKRGKPLPSDEASLDLWILRTFALSKYQEPLRGVSRPLDEVITLLRNLGDHYPVTWRLKTPENVGITLIRNVGNRMYSDAESFPRRMQSRHGVSFRDYVY
jgi:hypothetical protein